MKAKDVIEAVRYYGLYPIVQGGWHRFLKKTGILKHRFPTVEWDDLSLSSFLLRNTTEDRLRNVLEETRFFPVRSPSKNRSGLAKVNNNPAETIRKAKNIASGKFRYFSKLDIQLTEPVKWHCNPFTGAEWPKDNHWSDTDYFTKEFDDIKLVWELNRFSWVFDLVRAYGLTGAEEYAETFWRLFENWLEQNQQNTGVNWASGQECALRAMAWCFGLFAFLDEDATTEERIKRMLIAFSTHAERIEGFIAHAVRQKTNHSIIEACGLYTIGTLFPFFKKAAVWKKLGKRILEQEGLRQIYDDGSYVQQSMNYHRLMLQTYLWSFRLAEIYGDRFSDILYERIFKATKFLYQMQDESTGRVPNYGANDGSLILPLNSCDYLDYRPVLQSCWYFFRHERLYDSGPWDEDLLWLFGADAVNAPSTDVQRLSSQFSKGGYYTFRGKDSWAMIRCHSYCDRVGHIDLLHLDLWADGINLLRDCGSYKYYAPDEPELEDYFKSIWAHNTVVIDNESPLKLVSRFIWLPWPKAGMLKFERNPDSIEWKGVNLAYNRSPWNVIHSRQLKINVNNQRWEVIDEISGRGTHRLDLRWNLPSESEIVSDKNGLVRVKLPAGWFLEVSAEHIIKTDWLKASPNGGWESLYYNNKQPICTLLVVAETEFPARFITTIWKKME